jgi:hypothetical protein
MGYFMNWIVPGERYHIPEKNVNNPHHGDQDKLHEKP